MVCLSVQASQRCACQCRQVRGCACLCNSSSCGPCCDVQDHIRLACKPNYTDVRTGPDGTVVGVVEFDTYEDMRKAIRELDDSEFKNP